MIEQTFSVFATGNEPAGPLTEMPNGRYTFVGPNPHNKRNFYGTISVKDGTYKVE